MGADPPCNLVLDNTVEYLRSHDDAYNLTEQTRELGLLIIRGATVLSICDEVGAELNVPD
jgi:U6 snRNA-associated Sm-like protein LSm7